MTRAERAIEEVRRNPDYANVIRKWSELYYLADTSLSDLEHVELLAVLKVLLEGREL